MPNYPIVAFLVRFGGIFAAGLAILVLVAGFYLSLSGSGAVYAVGGLIAGALVYVLLKSYVELVAIISDMLLPKP